MSTRIRVQSGSFVRALAIAILVSFNLAPVLGCVSSSKFEKIKIERDRLVMARSALEDQAGDLRIANQALESEQISLLDELEDRRVETEALRATRANLEKNVSRLSQTEENLHRKLSRQEEELRAAEKEVTAIQSTYQDLVGDLEAELEQGAVEIEQLREGLRVVVADEILFASGSADLGAEGSGVLERVAAKIKKLDYLIDVEGHTDSLKIRGALKKRYPSNWELAAARAASVVRLFERAGIEGERLEAISRAEFHPVATNDDAEGREQNRRIEIRLRPREGKPIEAIGDAETDLPGADPSVVPEVGREENRPAKEVDSTPISGPAKPEDVQREMREPGSDPQSPTK